MKNFSYAKLVYWFSGLLIALVAGLSLTLSLLDWNQYRVPLAQFASNQMGMRVELAGDVSLAVFPRPSVSAESVHLFPATEGFSDIVATANRIGVNLGVASLLRGKISLQSMRLDGLDITLEETEAGRWQPRGWPHSDNAEGVAIEIQRFRLEGSRATLLPYGRAPYAVEGVSLQLEGMLPSGPLAWEGEFTVSDERIISTGRVRPVSVRDELSVKADFFLKENSLSVSGRMSPQGDLTGRLELAGDSLSSLLGAVAKITKNNEFAAPNLPFKLDVQFDKEGDITRLISRELMISATRGRLDLTAASSGLKNHVTGTVSMGVIDFDMWLAATEVQARTETISTEFPALGEPALTGAVDFHIEGFQVRNGLGQRIDAVVALDKGGVSLSSASALLPGATNAAFTGKLGLGGGSGKLLVEAGNISELASWLGLAFPEGVPAGRLTTAKLKAKFDYLGETWTLSDIVGQIDNTNLTGDIGGGLNRSGPWQVKLLADTLNLDAYMPKSSPNSGVDANRLSLPAETDVVFDLSIGDLHLMERGFNNTRLAGSLKDAKLDVTHMVSYHGGGNVEIAGRVEQGDGLPKFDVSIKLIDWTAPVASYFVPTLPMIRQSLKVNDVNGTLTIIGAKDALNLGLNLSNGSDVLVLSGLVGLENNVLNRLDLQGSFTHTDLAGLLRYHDVIDLKALPVRASLNMSKSSVEAPLLVRVGGDAAGGDMISELVLQDGVKKFDLAFNHDRVADFALGTGLKLEGLNHSASLRSDIRLDAQSFPDDWNLSVATFRNGDLSITGNLAVMDRTQIAGAVKITGADIGFQSSQPSEQYDQTALSQWLAEYTGSVDLALEGIHIAGQKVDAQGARLILGDGIAQITLGNSATMNAENLSASMNINLLEDFAYQGNVDAANLDIGALLFAEGYQQIVSATAAFKIDFSGIIEEASILDKMKASGSISGQNAVLNFMSVSGLTSEIQSAPNASGFLGKVGSLLRNGTTPVQTLESVFSIDNGTMLLESAKATGTWGNLSLDGQLNFPDEFLTLKGELGLSVPEDTPAIPVSYEGRFDSPNAQWSSRLFERFVISIIERRLRATLFKELEERTKASAEAGSNPGLAVFNRAFGLLNQLRKVQEEKQATEQNSPAGVPEGAFP